MLEGISIEADSKLDIDIDWGLDSTPEYYGIQRIAGSSATEMITFCSFITSTKIRLVSSRSQNVIIVVHCLYTD